MIRPLRRILALWRGQAGWLVLGVLVSLASAGAGVALLTLAGGSVGMALGSATGGAAAGLVLRWLGLGRVVLRYLERLTTHEATFRALADTRVWFFRGLARRGAGGLGFRRAGDALARLVDDVEALDGLYLRILVPLLLSLVLLPVLLVLIGRHSWGVAVIVAVLLGEAALVLPWIAARQARDGGVELAGAMAALRVAGLDALAGLREVRAFGAEGRMLTLVQARQSNLLQAQGALARRAAWANAGAFLLGQTAILALLLTAGADPVAAIAGVFLVVAAFEVVAPLPRAGALAGHAAAAASRVLEAAADAPVLAEPASPAPPPSGSGLRFEGVTFAWQPDRPVFSGLTLQVPEGTRVAILGPSGAGKSTLAALALRVVAPQAGRVLLGGVDIASLAAADLRARIGWLGQSTHLFDTTIRANLLIARPDADDDALWAALAAARLADMVHALPDRLDSWMGEGGARMSGGEGRRLALARALLSPASVLILDEPCQGLDAETERAFFATLNEVTGNEVTGNEVAGTRSVILIAHRLTGVERLDRIWRLSAGHAVAAAA